MLSLKSLLKPRNGSAPPSRQIAAAIEQLETERNAAESEIERLDDAEPALLLENDIQGLDEIARKRVAQERVVKKVQTALPLLQEQLAAARDEERRVEWSSLRAAILEADAAEIVAAARKLREAVARGLARREQASAAGFHNEVSGIPIFPHLLNVAEPGQPQIAMFETAIEHYRKTAPATPMPLRRPQRDSTPFFHDGAAAARPAAPKELPIIPHGVGAGPVRLYVEPAGPGSRRPAPQAAPRPPQPAAATKISRPAPQPAPPPPPLVLPKADADGNISIVVMRRGAEIAGKGRRPGEQIKVPFADAEAAVRAGIADFTPGEAAK